jgi:hypothetical protein
MSLFYHINLVKLEIRLLQYDNVGVLDIGSCNYSLVNMEGGDRSIEVIRLIRTACTAKMSSMTRTMKPNIDPTATITTVSFFNLPVPGHVCKKKKNHINS